MLQHCLALDAPMMEEMSAFQHAEELANDLPWVRCFSAIPIAISFACQKP